MNIHDVSRDNIADAPTVDCAQTWARVGDLDVRLQCRVRSRPSPTALYWVVDAVSGPVETWSDGSLLGRGCQRHDRIQRRYTE